VTDVTDGLIFTPPTVSFSQFQNWAVSKSPDFETGAAERPRDNPGSSNIMDVLITRIPDDLKQKRQSLDASCDSA
jgi:hypothetical protein